MKALYADDTGKGPGYGFLRVSEPGALAMQDVLTFSIRRASDQQCIGASDRQSAEVFLAPDGLEMDGETLCLRIGPAVVDNLDVQETYRITLQGADGSRAACGLNVPQVTYSPAAGGAGIGKTAAPAPTPPPPPPAPAPEPKPEPKPEPAPLQDLSLAPEPPKKKGGGLIIALIVLLLLAGGGFALWKFVLSKPDEAPKAAPEQVAPLSQARKHLGGPADPAESLTLAKKLRAEKESADAVFLLLEDAAGKGNAEAMLGTGEFYDPTATIDAGSIKKDPLQALDWYTKAKAGGNAEAEARLAALKAWAEAEAPKGTAGAKDVLDKMKQ